jgi:hypothetical protein
MSEVPRMVMAPGQQIEQRIRGRDRRVQVFKARTEIKGLLG